jgi:hypothetical protein
MKSRVFLFACFCVTCTLMVQAQQVVLNFTGNAQTWIVPNGVTSIRVDARGGQGGANAAEPPVVGGKGGRIQTTLAVTPGETPTVYVAGRGGDLIQPNTGGPGGFNGGGTGGVDNVDFNAAAGGGGASDVRQGGDDLSHRVAVTGGSGGAECCTDANGGASRLVQQTSARRTFAYVRIFVCHPINRIEEVSLTFSLYAGQQGGEPPWTETQNNVQMDSTGYTPQ